MGWVEPETWGELIRARDSSPKVEVCGERVFEKDGCWHYVAKPLETLASRTNEGRYLPNWRYWIPEKTGSSVDLSELSAGDICLGGLGTLENDKDEKIARLESRLDKAYEAVANSDTRMALLDERVLFWTGRNANLNDQLISTYEHVEVLSEANRELANRAENVEVMFKAARAAEEFDAQRANLGDMALTLRADKASLLEANRELEERAKKAEEDREEFRSMLEYLWNSFVTSSALKVRDIAGAIIQSRVERILKGA